MSKKRNNKARYAKYDPVGFLNVEPGTELPPVIPEDFLGGEPITDQLIDELVTVRGWKLGDLVNFQRQGFTYNRQRNSFFSPAEFDGPLFGK